PLSRGAPGRCGRGAAVGPSLRRAGVRRLPARMKGRLSTDGGARGNPGPAAYGYVLESEDGHVLDARGEAIGTATNNVAEYRGLIAGLESAVQRGVDEREAAELAASLRRVSYTAVRRAHNELADRLVNEALDAA